MISQEPISDYGSELRYIEREAREDGEREYIERCRAEGRCVYCAGDGYVITGWRYCGLEPIYGDCVICCGTGRADDSEQENAQ